MCYSLILLALFLAVAIAATAGAAAGAAAAGAAAAWAHGPGHMGPWTRPGPMGPGKISQARSPRQGVLGKVSKASFN